MTDDRSSFSCWSRCRRKTEFQNRDPLYIFIEHHPRMRVISPSQSKKTSDCRIRFYDRYTFAAARIWVVAKQRFGTAIFSPTWSNEGDEEDARRASRNPYINDAFILDDLYALSSRSLYSRNRSRYVSVQFNIAYTPFENRFARNALIKLASSDEAHIKKRVLSKLYHEFGFLITREKKFPLIKRS